MTTARQFLDFIRRFEQFKNLKGDPKQAIRELSDEQFKLAVWTIAEAFKFLKEEAIRRGIWDELTKRKNP